MKTYACHRCWAMVQVPSDQPPPICVGRAKSHETSPRDRYERDHRHGRIKMRPQQVPVGTVKERDFR